MSTFAQAVQNQEARTENNMKARKSPASGLVDLFYKIGASRGKDIIPPFVSAYVEDKEMAVRIALWARDVRGGAGERQVFRDILKYLDQHDPDALIRIIPKVPELGRWDDLFVIEVHRRLAFDFIAEALRKGDALAAKWCPRKGPIAVALRKHMRLTPKSYRKMLVNLTNVVETPMCAKEWDKINFSRVPSLAHSRYKAAFYRNAEKQYVAYVDALVRGDDPKVKVNASAVYPYDVIKGLLLWGGISTKSKAEMDLVVEQWKALPDYMGGKESYVMPLVDTSGSMTVRVSPNTQTTALEVAVSLGLYLSDKNVGKFKDTFLTFSSSPELMTLKGNVVQKMQQMMTAKWEMSTNLHAAFDRILQVAVQGGVPANEMPETLLILSDMQFNQCTRFDDSAIEMIRRKYEEAGYRVPNVVFWNLNSYDNVPVKVTEAGVALVSGFSPSIMTSILEGNLEDFSPYNIMMNTIMKDRYNF